MHAVAVQRRDHEGLLERLAVVELRDRPSSLVVRDEVDLVEHASRAIDAGRRERSSSQASTSCGCAALGIDDQARRGRHPLRRVQAAPTMARSSRRLGAKMPGVSMNTICASPSVTTPRIWRARGLHLVA